MDKRYKLTDDDVRNIRQIYDESHEEVEMYDDQIRRKEKLIAKHKAEIRSIKASRADSLMNTNIMHLARKFAVSRACVESILKYKTRKEVV